MSDAHTAPSRQNGRLAEIAPELNRLLTTGGATPELFAAADIRRETFMMPMRDGIRLATDLYLPPRLPAPVIVLRTPYERAAKFDTFMAFARAGYAVVAQDCRGTGGSEPDHWDWRIYEQEDGYDFVDWVQAQAWCDGFIGSCGGSYIGLTQWEMARHPKMSTIAPEVGGLISSTSTTTRLYMFLNAYSRAVGKGEGKVAMPYNEMEQMMHEETLAGGYYNEPLDRPLPEALLERFPALKPLNAPAARRAWLWERFNTLPPRERAELIKLALSTNIITLNDHESLDTLFGRKARRGRPTPLDPRASEIARGLKAPALMINAWYDWTSNNFMDSWEVVTRHAEPGVASGSRLLIGPDAHNVPGYHEGREENPELERSYRTHNIPDLLLHWYETVRSGRLEEWPKVIYYLMGANAWHAASAWPPPNARPQAFYLADGGALTADAPRQASPPDSYVYDPRDPTPTLGGSIVSYVYTPGSVDVSEVQKRPDVLVYTTPPLEHDLDVAGPLEMILYASSSAVDTDFIARLTDVFPDGRAIQLQSGALRTRFRNTGDEAELIEPGRPYRFEIDMWTTANRFKAGHRLRVDISSADFPRFDRNTNRGGEPGEPISATQTIYHDAEHPSHLVIPVMS